MAKRFMIVTNSAEVTSADRDAITSNLVGRGWEVWHWFEDMWLVANVPNDVSRQDVGEDLHVLTSFAGLMVYEVPATFNAVVYAAPEAHDWLQSVWQKPRRGPRPAAGERADKDPPR